MAESSRNVLSGEEQVETAVFAGYINGNLTVLSPLISNFSFTWPN